MIAVVDRETKRRFEVGPAPAARMPSQLVHDDVTILRHEFYSCRQSGKSGANNVGSAARHLKKAVAQNSPQDVAFGAANVGAWRVPSACD